MKLAASVVFYEKRYGLTEGLQYLKEKGYESIVYTLPRHEEYAAKNWSEEEFEAHFIELGNAIKASGLSLAFTTNNTGIYNDCVPDTYDARVDMCIKGVKATALMGGDTFAMRPVKYYYGHEDGTERSIRLVNDALKKIKEEADKVGVKVAIVNTDNDDVYGWCAKEIRELMDTYDLYLVIDPTDAFFSGCKVKDLIDEFNDRLVGVLMKDTEVTMKNAAMPFMGKADFIKLTDTLKSANPNASVVMMPELTYPRYQEFYDSDDLLKALEDLYYEIGIVMSGKGRS